MSDVEVGKVFGAWKVKAKHTRGYWVCLCTACGVSVKKVRGYDLRNGKSRMCRKCSASSDDSTHTMSETSEYKSWAHMKQRCLNPNNKDYDNYGGRGIEIFPLWIESFEAFLMYMGPKPHPDFTIERIDCNKNYEPGNVKWLSRADQTLNKRDNVKVTIGDETRTISEWSRHPDCKVDQFTLYKRVKRGWLEKFGPYDTIFK